MRIISKQRNYVTNFLIIGELFSLLFTSYLLINFLSDSSYIWLFVGSIIFINIPITYNLFSTYDKIVVDDFEIIFMNSFSNRKKRFLISEITSLRSYSVNRTIGPLGGTNAGEAYLVCDLEFGDKFSYQFNELEFTNFNEIKILLIRNYKNQILFLD